MKNMMETNDPRCERADELLKVLYEEASDAEASSFQQHLLSCSSCREEFTSLRTIRSSLVAWRQESLPTFSSAMREPAAGRTPSPIAALRAFFSLSPLWMKGAVACVSVLFCILAALAVFNSRKEPQAVNQDRSLSASQIEDLVNKRAQQKFDEMKARDEQKAVVAVADNTVQRQTIQSPSKRTARSQQQRPLTRAERVQLAADLRLSTPTEETELDLLSDRLNRQDD
jgi:hypothetical protein